MLDLAGFLERLLDRVLRGDAGVVGAGQPENFLAVHARLAGEDVLDGVVEDVAHVSTPVTFGGGMTMEYAGLADCAFGDEKLSVQPELIPFVLDGLRFVSF